MSIHIAAKQGEIADKILLPGDPLRAKFIAENFLEDAVCFNEVRNMFGYTGTYKGHRVSCLLYTSDNPDRPLTERSRDGSDGIKFFSNHVISLFL